MVVGSLSSYMLNDYKVLITGRNVTGEVINRLEFEDKGGYYSKTYGVGYGYGEEETQKNN